MSPASYPGRFVWHEIVTPEPARTKAFYAELFGWTYQDFATTSGTYPMIVTPSGPQGGILASTAAHARDVPPGWLGYVSVASVDAAARAARATGGKALVEPVDLPNVGRLAVLADPGGGVVALLRSSEADPPEVDRPGLGTFCWDQLNSSDAAAAKAFYRAVLGWTHQPFPGGGVEVFVREGGREAAGLMQAPAGVPSHWLGYVVVEGLDAACARVRRLGGAVHLPGMPVEGMGVIAVIADSTGATLGLFEPGP